MPSGPLVIELQLVVFPHPNLGFNDLDVEQGRLVIVFATIVKRHAYTASLIY